MTQEEAIHELQLCVDAWDKWTLPGCSSLDKYKEAVKMALAALRGPTREQVKAMKGKWKKVDQWEYGELVFATWECSECGHEVTLDAEDSCGRFCPHCGVPMTDKAVDIIMQRVEALKDGTTD